ncbi:MAG: amidohydrolase family protein, partial [Methanobacterium sp.]
MAMVRGNLLNVSTEEVYSAEITFLNGIITCVQPIKGDYKGLILPGFIDAHIHIESSMLTPARFAEVVVPHGTTSIIADPHEIANVMGLNGIKYMIKDSSTVPLKVFLTAPSCVPATIFETSGGVISTEEIEKLLEDRNFVALGEMMNFPGVIKDDPDVITKLNAAKKVRKPVDGHAPLLS